MTDLEFIASQLADRVHRMRYYHDYLKPNELLEWAEELSNNIADHIADHEGIHAECVSYDRECELIQQIEDLEHERDKLEKELESRPKRSRSKKSLEDVVLSPEEARKQFRVISGGAA